MGYYKEVEMIRHAHELDLLTTPYVFNPDEARAMAAAGADILVWHMGLTTRGTSGLRPRSRSMMRHRVAGGCGGTRCEDPVIVLCHGGPIAEPDDAAYVFHATGIPGSSGRPAWNGSPPRSR